MLDFGLAGAGVIFFFGNGCVARKLVHPATSYFIPSGQKCMSFCATQPSPKKNRKKNTTTLAKEETQYNACYTTYKHTTKEQDCQSG